jgi:hypothetical protein
MVPLSDRASGGAGLDLLLLLDKSAARAPEGCAAVTRAVALYAILLANLTSLDQGIAVWNIWSAEMFSPDIHCLSQLTSSRTQ